MNIQEIILNMYKEIKIILDENNIKYYALGGTFLGAIRHKGFIPWDDDIDIGIKRGDYEKFIKIVSSKLPNNLKLNTYKNDKDHHYYFSRIIDKRYTVKRNGSIDERLENIWIDIFPLDGMPNNLIIRNLYKIKMLFIRFLYHLSCFNKINIKRPGRPLFDRIIIYIIKKLKIGKRLNTKKLLDKIDKNLKKYDYDNSKYVINFMGQYKFKEMFKKKYYDDVKKYKFEDTYIYGPSNYDKILSRMYGDYMTPPPENERNTHFIDK